MSKSKKNENYNLRGDDKTLKLNSWGTVRTYWAPVVARGKLHIVFLGSDFPGDTPEGAAALVPKVKTALNIRFQNVQDAPTMLFVDRGRGFFDTRTGRITAEYKSALRESGLRTFWGDDASKQSGKSGDLMLHETVVRWIRFEERRSLPKNPWAETEDEFEARLRAIAQTINKDYNVEGLCRQFPERIDMLVERGGQKIGK